MSSQDHARDMQAYSYRLVEAVSWNPTSFDVITKVIFQCANGDICASLQVHLIEIKYLGFSRVGKGRDVNE